MMATTDLTTYELARDAVAVLRDGGVVLGGGAIDYAAADLLAVLVDLHVSTALDLERFPQVREFARLVVDGWVDQ